VGHGWWNVTLVAGADIRRVTRIGANIVTDTSRQLPSNWLYRRGEIDPSTGLFAVNGTAGPIDASASTTWWIDYSNFFEGVGALGGGNVTLKAGRDIINTDAFVPTNARMAGLANGTPIAPSPANLLEHGGGDLVVEAWQQHQWRSLLCRARRRIPHGRERHYHQFVPFTFVGHHQCEPGDPGSAHLAADHTLPRPRKLRCRGRGDVLLGPVSNAFLLPQGLNNKFWYKTYFQTYGEDSEVNVASFGGSVTHRLSVVTPGTQAARNILQAWMEAQNLFNSSQSPASRASNTQPWNRLVETTLNPFSTLLTIAPPTLRSTAFSGDVRIAGPLNLFPSPRGTVELAASGSVIGLNPIGRTTIAGQSLQAWSTAQINLSDANPAAAPGINSPLAYLGLVDRENANVTLPGFLNTVDALFAETGSYSGLAGSINVQSALHASVPVHQNDTDPLKIYSIGGDITGLTLFSAKSSRVTAAGDVSDVAFYIQNVSEDDVSFVTAGRDIIPYNENSALRSIANDRLLGNIIVDPLATTVVQTSTGAAVRTNVLAGDIQISGPGVLEVIAGRNLDLGTGANRVDGTGVGLTSIGNRRNPFLPFEGADLVAAAGLGLTNGLADSQLDFEAFIGEFLTTGGKYASQYLPELAALMEVAGDPSAVFEELPEEQRNLLALEIFYRVLRDAGRSAAPPPDQASSGTSGSGSSAAPTPESAGYALGFDAIAALFPASTEATGEVLTRARDIRTSSGGSISMLVPGGGVTLASDIFGNPLTPPGIVTEFGGGISIFAQGSVDIGRARIFTLRGGDIIIWSSEGDIAAGTAPKTVVTAPPTRVVVDATSATVSTDLGGLATGGGIGVLAAVKDVQAGDVDLIAPSGVIDAGDAGVRSTGNLNIAAVSVLNASNIQAGGTSSGVPSSAPAAPPAVAGSAAAANSLKRPHRDGRGAGKGAAER
jgi:hypothetical protein